LCGNGLDFIPELEGLNEKHLSACSYTFNFITNQFSMMKIAFLFVSRL